MKLSIQALLCISTLLFAACSAPRIATVDENGRFHRSEVDTDSLHSRIYAETDTLSGLSGKGRAIVSEPGNSERVTLYFAGNGRRSLVTIKNALGIEGGKMLSEGDSLLIYNKVDNLARHVAISGGEVSSVQHLASMNILKMMHYLPDFERVTGLYESQEQYLLLLEGGGEVFLDKESLNVTRVDQPRGSGLPYARIVYEGYATINGYKLPRRVTIFGADSRTKVALLVQSLEVNPESMDLNIDLPEDVEMILQ